MDPIFWFVIYIAVGVFISAIFYAICKDDGSTENENAGAACVTALFWPFMLIALAGYKIGNIFKKSLEK